MRLYLGIILNKTELRLSDRPFWGEGQAISGNEKIHSCSNK